MISEMRGKARCSLSLVNLHKDGHRQSGHPWKMPSFAIDRANDGRTCSAARPGWQTVLAIVVFARGGDRFARWILKFLSPSNIKPGKNLPPTGPEKSIAVLPFNNLSEDKANAYLADGIQDEILTRLSKIGT